MTRRLRRGKNPCRICGEWLRSADSGEVCADCASYGAWWDRVANRPAIEVTGQVSPQELTRLVDQQRDRVRVMLYTVEAPANRLARYLGRGPDLLPVVTQIQADPAGLSLSYRDRHGNTGDLWRARRMKMNVVVDGQPLLVVSE